MNKQFLQIAALLGALSVALGAFAAHKLKDLLPAEGVQVFDTGVRYQFYHTLALLLTGMLAAQFPGKSIRRAGQCFIWGIVLFSGSLYALTVMRILDNLSLIRYVGIITPLGGLFFIAGWLFLFFGLSRK